MPTPICDRPILSGSIRTAIRRVVQSGLSAALVACGGGADINPVDTTAPPPATVPTGLSGPTAVVVDAAGNVYIGEITNSVIWKLTPAGVLSVFAGTEHTGGITDGTGSAARFGNASSLALDAAGNIFVGDIAFCDLRKVTPAAVVTTIAGIPDNCHGNAAGVGTPGSLGLPYGVAVNAAGTVYFSQFGQDTINTLAPAGTVGTLAGSIGFGGDADGTGTAARFLAPYGLAVDASGNVYLGDSGNNLIRRITPAGVVSTFAGSVVGTSSGANGGSADGLGPAAQFDDPNGMAIDSAGNLYVADFVNETIRKISPAGNVTTLAGMPKVAGSADGTGSAARFNGPTGVAVDASGNVYVADASNHAIRKITPGGVVTTIAN